MFASGAGRIGNYNSCSFQTLRDGFFRPLKGSNTFRGNVGEIEKVKEYRVEMVCEASFIQDAVEALKKSHPCETPAYDVLKLEDLLPGLYIPVSKC